MLVLSRNEGERIVVGEGENRVVICLVRLDGQRAKIGIEAPKNMPVHREEVYEAIQREKGK